VAASRTGSSYTTTVGLHGLKAELTIGVTLPAGGKVASARLDGHRVRPHVTTTDRGVEVTVRAGHGSHHTLEVSAA
jgi:hypothetical protein